MNCRLHGVFCYIYTTIGYSFASNLSSSGRRYFVRSFTVTILVCDVTDAVNCWAENGGTHGGITASFTDVEFEGREGDIGSKPAVCLLYSFPVDC